MIVEKSVCDSIISTLLDLKGKSKDGLKSHKDLEELRIRSNLHPKLEEWNMFTSSHAYAF